VSYVFYCSKCRFDHAGECRSQYSYVVQVIDQLTLDGWKVETYQDSTIKLTKTIEFTHPIEFIPIVFRTTEHDEGWEG